MWWTNADAAELDLLVFELAGGYHQHLVACARCAMGYPPCPHVRRAIEAVLEWREARELRSRAEYLRSQRQRLEIGSRSTPDAPVMPGQVLRLGEAGKGAGR